MSRPRAIRISIRAVASSTVVDLEGEIDVGTSPIFRAKLFETLPQTSRLALNMTGVRYIDSSGIATLVEVRMKAQQLEKDLVLFGLSSNAYAVLKLTHLLGYFRIFDTEEQAIHGDIAPHG